MKVLIKRTGIFDEFGKDSLLRLVHLKVGFNLPWQGYQIFSFCQIHEEVYGISDNVGTHGLSFNDSAAQTSTRTLPVSPPAIGGERIDVVEKVITNLNYAINRKRIWSNNGTGWEASYDI